MACQFRLWFLRLNSFGWIRRLSLCAGFGKVLFVDRRELAESGDAAGTSSSAVSDVGVSVLGE